MTHAHYMPDRPQANDIDAMRIWLRAELDKLSLTVRLLQQQLDALDARVTALEP